MKTKLKEAIEAICIHAMWMAGISHEMTQEEQTKEVVFWCGTDREDRGERLLAYINVINDELEGVKMEEESKEDILLRELKREQKSVEIPDENIRMMLEEVINKKALKIGRKVLDEIYFHGKDEIQVSIRKSKFFDWSIVDIGVHKITGLLEDETRFICGANLTEKSIDYFKVTKELVGKG